MKTNTLLAAIALATFSLTANAQTIDETTTLTSGGLTAGTGGSANTFFGYSAGKITTGASNTFIGHGAGIANVAGIMNTALGWSAGSANTTGTSNLYLGGAAGYNNKTGNYNVYVGDYSGAMLPGRTNNGSMNTCLGNSAGFGNPGSGNIFIGYSAGTFSTGDNKLYIDNSDTAAPLIYGDFSTNQLQFNGRVAIGEGSRAFPATANGVAVNTYKLFVKGGILTEAVRVTLQNQWADYVFADDYALTSLDEVECFIQENGHLPNVPSAKQIAENGLELAEMSRIQQEKIEELTLHAIAQNKKIEKLEQQLQELQELKVIVKELSNKKQ